MLKVLNITLLTGKHGPDEIHLYLDLPEGCYPYEGNACARLIVAQGYGKQYIEQNLENIPVKVIEMS